MALNQRVLGSSPSASTIPFNDLEARLVFRLCAGHQWGIRRQCSDVAVKLRHSSLRGCTVPALRQDAIRLRIASNGGRGSAMVGGQAGSILG